MLFLQKPMLSRQLRLHKTKFAIRTDRDSLKCIFNITESASRLSRQQLQMAEFELDLIYLAEFKQ